MCAFGATAALSFVTLHIMSLFNISKWVGVSVGLSLLVVMLVLVLVFNKHLAVKLAALVVNAIADGLAASSLFVHLGEYPLVWQSVAVFAVMAAAFILYMLLTCIPFVARHFKISAAVYILIALGISFACLFGVKNSDAACVLALLFMIVFIAFLVSLHIGAEDLSEHITHLTYCSFAELAAVIFIVLVIISEGEALDLPVGDDSGKNKKHVPRDLT